MILMPQIVDVTANENARYKRNELEYSIYVESLQLGLCVCVDEKGWDIFFSFCDIDDILILKQDWTYGTDQSLLSRTY